MAIYITGDRHGELRTLGPKFFPEQKDLTRDDYLIITGDFGGVWDGSLKENAMLKLLEARSFTTLFLDGNHENHAMLNALPVEEWHGGDCVPLEQPKMQTGFLCEVEAGYGRLL